MQRRSGKSFFNFRMSHVITGMVAWGFVAYLLIFVVLDTPRFEDESELDQLPEESEFVAEPLLPAVPEEQPTQTQPRQVSLSTDWMDNTSLSGGWYIQVGSYKSRVEAEVERLKYSSLEVSVHTQVGADGLTHLVIGPYSTQSEADNAVAAIRKEIELSKFAVRQIEGPVVAESTEAVESMTATEAQAVEPLPEAPAPAPEPEPSQPQSDEVVAVPQPEETAPAAPTLEQVVAAPQPVESPPPAPQPVAAPSAEPAVAEGNWYIQVGAFQDVENARQLGKQVRSHNLPLKIDRSETDFVRVLIGPYQSRDRAATAQSQIVKALGVESAIVRQIDG